MNDPSVASTKEVLLKAGIDLSGGSGGVISWNPNGSILATLMVEQLVKKLIWRMKCSML